MNPLRIAIAGAGQIGRRHAELVRDNAECTLVAFADPAPAAAAHARAFGTRLYASLDEMLNAEQPDGVIVATPNALHVDNGLACIAAGVPALIEKPVAHVVAAGERLRDATEQSGARILVGHHRRHSAIMARACEVVQAGTLGPIVAVLGSALYYKPDAYFDEAPWRSQPGGGPILINMIHEIGNLRSLCGEIDSVQAFASSATRGLAVEDSVAINFQFASGALGTFLLSDTAASARSWEQTSGENRCYAVYPDEDCYLIAGTMGSLAIPTMRLRTYASKESRSWWNPFETKNAGSAGVDPLERQLVHFCAVIRGDAVPLVTVNDGLQNLRVIEAVAEAARTGKVISIH